MLTVAPHLNDAKFQPLVNSFARITLLGLDSYEFLRERGLVGEKGQLLVECRCRSAAYRRPAQTSKRARPIAVVARFATKSRQDLAAALARHVEDAEVVSGGDESE